MSTILKTDAAGTLTIPADVCRAAGIEPGGELAVKTEDGAIVLNRPRPPIWEQILALTVDIPPEELGKLPRDGSAQLDHYLYGHPKRPE